MSSSVPATISISATFDRLHDCNDGTIRKCLKNLCLRRKGLQNCRLNGGRVRDGVGSHRSGGADTGRGVKGYLSQQDWPPLPPHHTLLDRTCCPTPIG